MKPTARFTSCAYRMTSHRWHSGVLESEGVLAGRTTKATSNSRTTSSSTQATFTLLANVSEEGFHLETIPFLQGKDRKTVIERKPGQQFSQCATDRFTIARAARNRSARTSASCLPR